MTTDVDAVDPWSPGYVTPASTPSPGGSRPRSGGHHGVHHDGQHGGQLGGQLGGHSPASSSSPGSAAARTSTSVAVSVRSAHHVYVNYNFNGRTEVPVLNDFNMTVRQGEIYALLGSSGCGKTTVLRALVGQHKLTSGVVQVFGKEPRTKGIGIPGPSLGYMPQELAVIDGFTILETLRYFGWLAGMASADIDKQCAILIRLLDLPGKNRLVCDLSGGQQRRVSLAVALLHSPPLLILDEPTVGVDPLVRQSVWEHLLDLTASSRTTVIITTHYIDEARQANVAGLMRKGALLVEDSPTALMSRLACTSLEDVLLKFCLAQDNDAHRQGAEEALRNDGRRMDHELEVMKEADAAVETCDQDAIKVELRTSKKSSKVKALVWKNLMWIWRHWIISALLFFLPAFISIVYCGAIGQEPRGLAVAVVNSEADCSAWTGKVDCSAPADLSCLFLEQMRAASLQPVMFSEEQDAEQAVLQGRSWAMLHFTSNFSESLMERASITVSPENPYEDLLHSIEHSTVDTRIDMSQQIIGQLLQRTLYNTASQALEVLNGKCALNAHLIRPPLQFRPGGALQTEPTFLDYSLPGLILSLVFMFGFTTTMSSLLPEKNEKILERSLVYGVSMGEVLIAQFIVQLLLVSAQISGVFVVVFAMFGTPLLGPVLPYVLLCLAQGICGMWYGLFTAVIFDSITAASLIGCGSYFAFVFMSSMLWPLEGMHALLRPLARMLPMTTATVSLRNIALRAWTLYHPGVYIGFLTTVSWIFAFVILTFFTIKLRF